MKKLLSRVPEITIFFWIIKILSTTVGESAADFLSQTMNLGLSVTSCIMGVLLAAALLVQLRLKRYVPASYWSVVVLMSIVGTLITDKLVDDMGISLVTTSVVFTITMLAGFAIWYMNEKTLSIHTINTDKREKFYWLIILLAFALGTAGGDLISEKLALGYGVASLIFGGAIAIIALGFFVFKMNETLAFWLAFILTRPLGASIGDLLSKPASEGGVGLGTTVTSGLFLSIILILVVYLTMSGYDKISPEDSAGLSSE